MLIKALSKEGFTFPWVVNKMLKELNIFYKFAADNGKTTISMIPKNANVYLDFLIVE